MSQTKECIKKLDMVLTDLRAEGMETVFIIAALAEICVKAAKSEPEQAAAHLEALTAILDANAQAIRGGRVVNLAHALFGDRL
jgi:hypothetical protein